MDSKECPSIELNVSSGERRIYSRREMILMSRHELEALSVQVYDESNTNVDTLLIIARIITYQTWEAADCFLHVNRCLFQQEVMIRHTWMQIHNVDNTFFGSARFHPDPPLGINLSTVLFSACPQCAPADPDHYSPRNDNVRNFLRILIPTVDIREAMLHAESFLEDFRRLRSSSNVSHKEPLRLPPQDNTVKKGARVKNVVRPSLSYYRSSSEMSDQGGKLETSKVKSYPKPDT